MRLPASDIVAVLDVKRVMGELLPRLKNISVAGIGKTASEIETFAKLSGIDPAQVQAAVLGVKMTETLSRGSGVLLLQGVSVDAQKLSAAVQATGNELQSFGLTWRSSCVMAIARRYAGADWARFPGVQ